MQIGYSRGFKKVFKKCPQQLQTKFGERLELFVENRHHPTLSTHALHGKWKGCKSINITGDVRAVYEVLDDDCFKFVAIGSHSELYS